MTEFSERYGPWAVVAGGSDGIGASFAHALARRGLSLVLLARRAEVLDAFAAEVRAAHGVEVRTFVADLTAPQAIAELAAATADLEIGLFIANAGGDDTSALFLGKDLDQHLALVRRNCLSVVEAAYRFGGPMVSRGRGGVILVTSGAAWAGGVHLAAYGATKAFDLILAEALWAEWHDLGVDVLGLVVTATDTPSMHRALAATGGYPGALADPDDVAGAALDHLGDGPTWMCGAKDPLGPPPFGTLTRREAVLRMSRRAPASEGRSAAGT
jgi:short-subunit dehydrogenase